jgi:hypothetical protein
VLVAHKATIKHGVKNKNRRIHDVDKVIQKIWKTFFLVTGNYM